MSALEANYKRKVRLKANRLTTERWSRAGAAITHNLTAGNKLERHAPRTPLEQLVRLQI